MRGLFTVLIILFFGIIFPLAVLTYTLNTVANSTYIKSQLREAAIYKTVAAKVPEFIGTGSPEDESENLISEKAQNEIKDLVKKEVTGEYLQSKAEPFIDDTFLWLARKKSDPPQVSLADLVAKVEKLPNGKHIPSDTAETFSKPLKWEPKNADQIKDWYSWFTLAPLAFGVVSALLLAGLFFVSVGWRAKLRKAALCIFLPTFFGILGSVATLFIGQVFSGLATGTLDGSPFTDLKDPVEKLIAGISQDITRQLLIIYGVALAVTIVLFITSFFVERKKKTPLPTPGA